MEVCFLECEFVLTLLFRYAMLKLDMLIRNPNFNLSSEIIIQSKEGGRNFLHVLAMNNWVTVAEQLLEMRLNETNDSILRQQMSIALSQQDDFYGRTPLQMALTVNNQVNNDSISVVLRRLKSLLSRDAVCGEDSAIVPQTTEFVFPTPTANTDKENVNQSIFQSVPPKPNLQQAFESQTNNGGWDTHFTNNLTHMFKDTNCDFVQYHGLPTMDSLSRIIETGKPVIFRGGAASLDVDLVKLSLDSIRRRLGMFNVTTARIPHRKQHSSPFREASDTTIILNKYLDYVVNESNDGSEVQYLFSTRFYRDHPDVLEGMEAPFHWMRQLDNATVLQATDMDSSLKPLELNAQIYIGEFLSLYYRLQLTMMLQECSMNVWMCKPHVCDRSCCFWCTFTLSSNGVEFSGLREKAVGRDKS